VIAYHFVGDKLRDGRPVPADGEWLTHGDDVVICQSGLHASKHPFDALQYAPGSTLCLVDCEDIVHEQNDKLVCRKRRIIARIDAEKVLREFACSCALSVVHLWKSPPIVIQYLETQDESIRAAAEAAVRSAVRSAARAAVWDAAEAAARSAARSAAWDAAEAEARAAAEAAARAAAWGAARDAARDTQKRDFLNAVENEFIAIGIVPRTGDRT
jgi:hypothetical protein